MPPNDEFENFGPVASGGKTVSFMSTTDPPCQRLEQLLPRDLLSVHLDQQRDVDQESSANLFMTPITR